jgi:quercetin dioxygenase-like cupin family protein
MEKKQIDNHKDDRGVMYWVSPRILGFEYKEVSVGSVEPGKKRGNHYHKKTNEKLMCISGKMTYLEEGSEKIILEPGDMVDVPLEKVHTVINEGDEVARFIEFKSKEFDENDTDIFRRE